MPSFSEKSNKNLEMCATDLKRLFNEVIKGFDCKVICGYRKQAEQDAAYISGASKIKWPNSKHNKVPSDAVDVLPYPINWLDINRFYFFAGYVKAKAEEMNIKTRWGGDWDNDTDVLDQSFNDLVHFELI